MASDDTEARRARVQSLWLKPDRQIAQILLDEGYGGPIRTTSDARTTQLASMKKQVYRDREALRKQWRETKQLVAGDTHQSRGEHLAVLESLQEMGVEMLTDPKLKGTPKAQALQAVTRIVEARGKALGVAEQVAPEDPDDETSKVPFLGIVVGVKKLTPEAVKRINGLRRSK